MLLAEAIAEQQQRLDGIEEALQGLGGSHQAALLAILSRPQAISHDLRHMLDREAYEAIAAQVGGQVAEQAGEGLGALRTALDRVLAQAGKRLANTIRAQLAEMVREVAGLRLQSEVSVSCQVPEGVVEVVVPEGAIRVEVPVEVVLPPERTKVSTVRLEHDQQGRIVGMEIRTVVE